ncbi:formin-like protein 15 [Leguminivora glycinivorella]|uniref:formin-like protein 15 n=1 Tax=Leguminivora glycinivorella TaxID=1035111 RepID=UPI00200FD1FE|nr:formin-like protein 15 [Leguminivora glycinivorella]
MYIELEPRVLAPCDVPLLDYAGEPVGLLQDFNVTWRLHGGLLVDELECGEEDTASLALRAIPLSELQAAIAAAAPPSPPPPPASPEPDHHPPCSTPIPTEEPAAPTEAPTETIETTIAKTEPATPAKQRKRKQEEPTVLQTGAGKLFLTPELRLYLTEEREFSLSGKIVSRVIAMRAARILAGRAQLKEQPEITEFRGFDEVDKSDLMDIGGFLGFTATTESEATDISLCLSRLASAAESDDDGFFEQSTFSGSEGARPELTPPPPTPPLPAPPPPVDYSAQPEWMSWRADVVARASAGEARGLDVRALGAAVLNSLPEGETENDRREKGAPAAFTTVLDAAAKDDADVSRLFLATLFLANAGNVEVVQPPPLTLNSFSLRLVSRDERLYSAAADSDPAFLTR